MESRESVEQEQERFKKRIRIVGITARGERDKVRSVKGIDNMKVRRG